MDKVQRTEKMRTCANCGAELSYQPGTTQISCRYCGHKEKIIIEDKSFEELDLLPYLKELGSQSHSEQIAVLHCKNCGANQHVEESYKSLQCIYCSSPLIIEQASQETWILPRAILPFQIDKNKALEIFNKWINRLWFAPNKLKKATLDPQNTKGVYIPFWTFDAELDVIYSGQRGDYYYVTRQVRDSNGKVRSQQVRKTRWTPWSGHLIDSVDDTLINASKRHKNSLPPKVVRWNLSKLQPFDTKFLSGFVTEKYSIPLIEGHKESKREAEKIAEGWCRQDIGGDTQRIISMKVSMTKETFKHILLPMYVSTYKFKGKAYNFFVNGENGLIHGKRPYSVSKIAFLVIGILILLGVIWVFSANG